MGNMAMIAVLNVQKTVMAVVAIESQDTAMDASQAGMEYDVSVQECVGIVAVTIQRVSVMNVVLVTPVMSVLAGVHQIVMDLDAIGMTIPAISVALDGTWSGGNVSAVVTAVIMAAIRILVFAPSVILDGLVQSVLILVRETV
jgi:hypothetical protein